MRFLAVVYQRHPHARRSDPHGIPAVTAAGGEVSLFLAQHRIHRGVR